jgi:RNA polymerase sigma-70 factor, ECF subfamily
MAKALVAASIPCTPPDAVARLDEAAFSGFYRGASRALWAYVYRVTGNAADADDIVQEAFLRVLRADLGPSEEDWRRYLYRVASNLVVDRWRRRQRRDQHEADALVSAAVDARVRASGSSADTDNEVARTFGELSSRERALLWLAYVEGDSHEEIAASLGLGRRSIKVLLFRARRRLRDLLKAKGRLQ